MRVLKGKVIHGENIGKKQGYPTANLSRRVLLNKNITNGVYISETNLLNKKYPSILVVGVPGVCKFKKGKVEIFLLNKRINLYGKEIVVCVLKKIRPLYFYRDRTKLLARIKKDIITTKNYFKSSR